LESTRKGCTCVGKYTDLIGCPFVVSGRDYHTGLDCYGLAEEVFRRFGKEIPEYDEDYHDKEAVTKTMRGGLSCKCWKKVKDGQEPPTPSLMAIRFGVPAPFINHVGIYIGNGKFIHTRENTGVVIESTESPVWRHVIEGYYEYVGE
jgi:cell wall-associated NlpC family hydrolase